MSSFCALLAFSPRPRYTGRNFRKGGTNMARNTNRIHDWRKLKWPFCVTFLYYALLCLYTGSAEASEAGFLAVLIIALLIDAVAYACYLFFLSKAEENMGKLWFAFILAYVLASSDKLAIVWQMLAANAGTH